MDPDQDEDAFIEAFQERLVRARLERGLTQQQLALSLGLKKSTYKKYEARPRSSFPLYLLPKLSIILGRPVEYWVYGNEIPGRRLRVIK